MVTLPRLVVAAPASGHGKTTVATGLMAALTRRGLAVSGHKVGPDYIDPGYHALATGRPGRNLDPHLVGEGLLVPLLLHGARDADVALIEGVMGLYDGRLGDSGYASTAHVAGLTDSPVLLVVDVSHASRTIGAVVKGLAVFDESVRIGGVILNKAGSQRHADEVVASLDLPVLGVLPRDAGVVAPSRHLGLVPAAERAEAAAALDRLSERIEEHVDLDAVLALAQGAPALEASPWDPALVVTPPSAARPVVALAGGRAFTFRYAETEELLRAAGCEPVEFDPLHDTALPEGTAGIYLGGGFPEVHAPTLSANLAMRNALDQAVSAGIPTVGECAGLLYLARSLDAAPMVGALDVEATMSTRLTLGYRTLSTTENSVLAPAGTTLTGHEFHRTRIADLPLEGVTSETLSASYLHVHWAGHPAVAQRFAEAVHAATPLRSTELANPLAAPLLHHGDREVGEGLLDFAVNVYDGPRPAWLDKALLASLDRVHAYPDATDAEAAVARRHRRMPTEVLATAGAAEAFTLIARLRDWQHPVMVHPQFTEPEAALRSAGHDPGHVVLTGDFTLDPDAVPSSADLVVVGNPTNPTGALHPASTIRALLRPGRLVVVDEAFMDCVPGETESLTGHTAPGLLVTRSLTKLWSVPGIRAGYVVGDPAAIRDLRRLQPPWALSTPAAAVLEACSTDEARLEAAARAEELTRHRQVLVEELARLGVDHVAGGRAPFVLARVGEGVHQRLRGKGIALRRADSFPGLGPEWVRIAVRRPDLSHALVNALRDALG